MANTPIAIISGENKKGLPEVAALAAGKIYLDDEQTIDTNVYYGFQQLTKVAVKALSPGINDPGTAVASLRALASLLAFRLLHHPETFINDDKGLVRVVTRELTLTELFDACFLPVWQYGKADRFVQQEMHHLLQQLQGVADHPVIKKLHILVKKQMALHEDGAKANA